MDLSEEKIKEEVSSFVSSLQRLLPKKKDIIVIEPKKPKLTKLSDVHAEAKGVFPKCFVGAKLVIMREILERVKLVQNYQFGKSKGSYLSFSHMLHRELEPKREDNGLLVDSAGSATATYSERMSSNYEMHITSKIKDMVSSETEVVIDKYTDKSVASVYCGMADIDPKSLRIITQWTYKLHPDFSIGTEVGLRPMVSPPLPDLSLSGRYERPSFTVSSTISNAGFQLCLFKKFSHNLRIAAIMSEGKRTQMSFGLALHKSYPNGSEMKVFLDSMRCGGFTFQKEVYFYEHNEARVLRLVGSTLVDKQRRVRFGFGFNLEF